MRSPIHLTFFLSICALRSTFAATISPDPTVTQTQVDLKPYLNNKAAALNGHSADFDGSGGSYPAEYLPNEKTFVDASVKYSLPHFRNTSKAALDNINCTGQTIEVPKGKYYSLNFLGATDGTAVVNGQFSALYDDGTVEKLGFVVAPWWFQNPSDGPITAPYLNEGTENGTTEKNYNITRLFTFGHHLDNSKVLTSLILPNETGTSQLTGVVSIHVFAMTLIGNSGDISSPSLNVHNVRSTTKFRDLKDSSRAQLIEVTLTNLAPSTLGSNAWITSNHTVTIYSSKLKTVLPGHFRRLRGGDQLQVIVGVQTKSRVKPGSSDKILVEIKNSKGKKLVRSGGWKVTAGIPAFVEGDKSLSTHESPEWFDGAKFGLFVHWGIYSVPAWTISGTQYSEWYWYWQQSPANSSSAVWTHHKEVYGESFLYDDFFPNFTASAFDANEFVQFVSDIGARYYVITTKHHDGFALFDTGDSTHRNSLHYGPKRDLVGEIVEATKKRQPHLKVGTYFSLPEWFNPAFAKYGHAGGGDDLYHRRSTNVSNPGYNILQRTGFAGGLAHNAYNSSTLEPYTGYIPKDDFLEDIMKPQLEALMYNYDTDILWCDVGGPTIFPELAPSWFNHAAKQGRQVTANARCGANYSDFDDPEYSATSALKTRKWESSEGSDPYSYGYNRNTSWDAYRNGTYILHSLIDIVSKNGNYLIDVGPQENGTIVPPSVDSLLTVGKWLNQSGEAIYDTQYWFVAAEDGDLRFTTTPHAFYLITLSLPPSGQIKTSLPLPITSGDIITFLSPDGPSKPLTWNWDEEGNFVLDLGGDDELMELMKTTKDAWAFRAQYV